MNNYSDISSYTIPDHKATFDAGIHLILQNGGECVIF